MRRTQDQLILPELEMIREALSVQPTASANDSPVTPDVP
jgi:hypothetical protein